MAFVTGSYQRKIKSYNKTKFILACASAQNDGFELNKTSVEIDWPRFWQVKYKADFRKYFILDESKIAVFSQKEIDFIKTGK